jgi:hypothetical protein
MCFSTKVHKSLLLSREFIPLVYNSNSSQTEVTHYLQEATTFDMFPLNLSIINISDGAISLIEYLMDLLLMTFNK